MSADLAALENEIRRAAVLGGLQPRQVALISPLGARKGTRYAYRIETDDGRVVKARHHDSASEAQRVHELRRGLDDTFAPVLQRVGPVLIEGWLDGTMLDTLDAEAWTHAAGTVLGQLHARPLAPHVPREVDTGRWSAAADADLALLERANVLSPTQCGGARGALRCHDPGRAAVALIHKDFCAENMLIDAHGRLRVIDTEQLAIEPIGFDLAWTWHRWPMSAQGLARFTAAYRAAAPPDAGPAAYWRVVVGLTLARVFFQRMPERLDAQLARLHRCLADAANGEAGPT